MIRTINPATGELLAEYAFHSAEEIRRSLDRASSAFDDWRGVALSKRCAVVRSLSSTLLAQRDHLALLAAHEMGKPINEGQAEIEKSAKLCDYYADRAAAFLEPRRMDVERGEAEVRYAPLGITLAIMPWNFPFWQVFRQAVPAILAGNSVILKHAENVSGCGIAIEEIFRQQLGAENQVPVGLFQTLRVPHGDIERLIEHPKVLCVSLTGSERAARSVAALAGKHLTKTILELGGSDPFIVLPDADLKAAARAAAKSRLLNAGQSCIAAKRFLVAEPLYESFVEQLRTQFSRYRVGVPTDPKTRLGPVARGDIRDTLHDQVNRTVAGGAKLVCGGELPASSGFFYPPTILSEIQPEMPCFEEEFFGPVACVACVPDDDSTILRLANQTPFGLGASLWTKHDSRAQYLVDRIDCGTTFVNDMVKSDPRLPFGGTKRSGYGRELAEDGLREFVNVKSVWQVS